MGLLDEAIREHLELKRRSGADPGDIARAEHEALEPIFPVEPGGDADGAAPGVSEEQQTAASGTVDGLDDEVPEAGDERHFSNVGQETAELDMQSVLNEGLEQPSASTPPPSTQPVRAGSLGEHAARDSMGWEEPGEAERRTPPEEVPGQERMSFE